LQRIPKEEKMSKQIAAALAAPFTGADLKTRPGRGGQTFTYADARAVAQRLDDVLGLAGWQFEVKIADPARFVVHGTLIAVIDGVTTLRQDFGYPNSAQSDEPYKESSSDCLRRCASQLGVGRSLYAGGTQTPVSVAPAPLSVDSVKHSQPSISSTDPVLVAAMLFAEGECPDHRTPWSFKPAGISKAGKPYNAFYACGGKSGGEFCKRKPSITWVNAQAAPTGEPERNENDLESLPF
jgi:hypothetical protein